jgi:hypothetical protein
MHTVNNLRSSKICAIANPKSNIQNSRKRVTLTNSLPYPANVPVGQQR